MSTVTTRPSFTPITPRHNPTTNRLELLPTITLQSVADITAETFTLYRYVKLPSGLLMNRQQWEEVQKAANSIFPDRIGQPKIVVPPVAPRKAKNAPRSSTRPHTILRHVLERERLAELNRRREQHGHRTLKDREIPEEELNTLERQENPTCPRSLTSFPSSQLSTGNSSLPPSLNHTNSRMRAGISDDELRQSLHLPTTLDEIADAVMQALESAGVVDTTKD